MMRPIQFYADAVRQLSTAESSAAPKGEEKLQRIIKAQHCRVHPTAVATVTVVATAQARRPGSSDGDGEADVERATKKWSASEQWQWAVARRASEHWQRKAIRLVPNTSSGSCCQSTLTQQQRQKYLGHTVSVPRCNTKMREPLAKQYRSKSSSNTVNDKQNL